MMSSVTSCPQGTWWHGRVEIANITFQKLIIYTSPLDQICSTPPGQEKPPELEIIKKSCPFAMNLYHDYPVESYLSYIHHVGIESTNLKYKFLLEDMWEEIPKPLKHNNTRLPYHHHLQKAPEQSCYPSSCCLGEIARTYGPMFEVKNGPPILWYLL